MINFISTLPKDLRSGGFSALGLAGFEAVSQLGDSHYVGPVNPRPVRSQKLASQIARCVGLQGSFYTFSRRRLESIAQEVHARCEPAAHLDVFHGFTSWVLFRSDRPYVALSDCTFRDYIDLYHRRTHFRPEDLERIESYEASWLRNARFALFTTDWAARRAVVDYNLDPDRVRSVGIFGEIDIPGQDAFAGGKEFAFVAYDFEAKGGRTVLEALRQVREYHADASLVVVGEHPSGLAAEGVTFVGFLRKEVPDEYQRYQKMLGSVRALVHPTKSDIAPLVIIEAGYLGCPVITASTAGIPELVEHGRTGFLLDDATRANEVADAMRWMIENTDQYPHMRNAVLARTRRQHSKGEFQRQLVSYLRKAGTRPHLPV